MNQTMVFSCKKLNYFFESLQEQATKQVARGFQSDLSFRLSRGQTKRDSSFIMKHFFAHYECIFHLVYIRLSANAQFWHNRTSILFARTPHVLYSRVIQSFFQKPTELIQDSLHQSKPLLLKPFCIWLQIRSPPTF